MRRKQISSEVAFVADLALVLPERYMTDCKLTSPLSVSARGQSNFPN